MSMSINIQFSKHFEQVVGADITKIADKALQRTIAEADSICQQEAPVKTGNLRRSIGTSHPSICRVCLTSNAKYWRVIQYGSKAHTITGNPLLAWKGKEDGKMHFARKVNHPGTEANPFVTRTAKRIVGENIIQLNIQNMLIAEGIMG